MSRAASLVSLCVVMLATRSPATHAQVRDAVAPALPAGTAVIEGAVLTDDADRRPIHRATVTIMSGALGMPQSVVTDDAGAFVFTGVVAGNYTVQAKKPAYVPAFYGATRAGEFSTGTPLAVLDGQHLSGVTLRLPRGAVITGALRSTDGGPAGGVSVQVSSIDVVNGVRREGLETRAATTDDRGVYRVFGLAAGAYVVIARPASVFTAITGGGTRQVSPEEIRWAEQAVAATNAAAAPPGPAPARGRPVAYAPVYYPGSPDAAAATLVTVGAGEERAGIDFTIAPVPAATVAGQVVGVDGAPAVGASVGLTRVSSASDLAGAIAGRLGGRPSADGSFSLAGVTPGRYRLTARALPSSAQARDDTRDPLIVASALISGGGATLWGEEEITVDGQDISGLTIRLRNGLSVSGRVVVESTGTAPDLSRIRVSLGATPAGGSRPDLAMALVTSTSAPVAADGTFTVRGLTPDRYRLTAGEGGLRSVMTTIQPDAADPSIGGLTLQSAMWQGRDIADAPIDLAPGMDVSGVVVTLTDRQTRISGTVRDSAGRPTPNFPILAFSTDRALWFAGSRRIQRARVLSDGTFTIAGLPAGEYYIAALTDLNPNESYDPSFLDSIVAAAIKITVADGERKTQGLKLAGG